MSRHSPVKPPVPTGRSDQPWAVFIERFHARLARFEEWAHQSPLRGAVSKVLVTVIGPVIVVIGAAMTVLPGPGLVVIALGLAVLALEYQGARVALHLMGRTLSRARDAALPRDGSPLRRALGIMGAAAFFVATFALTTAVTAYVGAGALM